MLRARHSLAGAIVSILAVPGLVACQESSWQLPPSTVRLPLAQVSRSDATEKSVFDRPPVILIARIWERCEVEETDAEGGSLSPPRFWSAAKALPMRVVRVNERRKEDPDLARGAFLLEQMERGERPIRFEFGKLYLLLLKPSPVVKGRPAAEAEVDRYAFALPQGGFVIEDGSLIPLERGGELDKYAGRPIDDILSLLKR